MLALPASIALFCAAGAYVALWQLQPGWLPISLRLRTLRGQIIFGAGGAVQRMQEALTQRVDAHIVQRSCPRHQLAEVRVAETAGRPGAGIARVKQLPP